MDVGKGLMISIPRSRLRKFILIFLIWQITAIVLGFWWGSVILKQSGQISRLESGAGVANEIVIAHQEKTKRMLFWESSVFVLTLFTSGIILVLIFVQDYKRSKSLEAFFASFTHELKTPLASIRLQAETLANTKIEEKSKKHLERLLEDSMRLEAQVEKTLELARIEGGGSLYRETIRVKPWLEKFIRSWEENSRSLIKINLNADDVVLYADKNALSVIFKNLIENSYKHSGLNPPVVEILVKQGAQSHIVSYSDNGKGSSIVPTQLGKLYMKGPNSSGAGVGLYLTSQLMNKMEGEMKVLPGTSGFSVQLTFPKVSEGVMS